MALSQGPPRCFADDREGFHEQIVEGFASRQSFAELRRFSLELGVGQFHKRWLLVVNGLDQRLEPFEFPLILASENFLEKTEEHKFFSLPPRAQSSRLGRTVKKKTFIARLKSNFAYKTSAYGYASSTRKAEKDC